MEYSYNDLIKDLRMGREIEFLYKDTRYSISTNKEGWYLTAFGEEFYQAFNTVEELLEKALIEGRFLKEIWDKVKVTDAC